MTIAGFVLGILGVMGLAWIPLLGLALAVTGLTLTNRGRQTDKSGLSTAALVLNILALVTAGIVTLATIIALIFDETGFWF